MLQMALIYGTSLQNLSEADTLLPVELAPCEALRAVVFRGVEMGTGFMRREEAQP